MQLYFALEFDLKWYSFHIRQQASDCQLSIQKSDSKRIPDNNVHFRAKPPIHNCWGILTLYTSGYCVFPDRFTIFWKRTWKDINPSRLYLYLLAASVVSYWRLHYRLASAAFCNFSQSISNQLRAQVIRTQFWRKKWTEISVSPYCSRHSQLSHKKIRFDRDLI